MKFFFTENLIIQISAITTLNMDNGVLRMLDDKSYFLNNKEVADLKAILIELHSQSCAK